MVLTGFYWVWPFFSLKNVIRLLKGPIENGLQQLLGFTGFSRFLFTSSSPLKNQNKKAKQPTEPKNQKTKEPKEPIEEKIWLDFKRLSWNNIPFRITEFLSSFLKKNHHWTVIEEWHSGTGFFLYWVFGGFFCLVGAPLRIGVGIRSIGRKALRRRRWRRISRASGFRTWSSPTERTLRTAGPAPTRANRPTRRFVSKTKQKKNASLFFCHFRQRQNLENNLQPIAKHFLLIDETSDGNAAVVAMEQQKPP